MGRGCTLGRPGGLTNVVCMRNEHVRVFVANFEEDQAVSKQPVERPGVWAGVLGRQRGGAGA